MDILRELFHSTDASGSRSTILKPVTWMISVLLSGDVLLVKIGAPEWLIFMVSGFILLVFLLFMFAYVYCLFTDKDAIRSEKYSIQKMAIEKGVFGDNVAGIVQMNVLPQNGSREINGSEEEQR